MTAGALLHAPMQGAGSTRTARRIQRRAQLGQESLGPGHGAAQAVADPDGQRRGRVLALLHDVEVVIEGRDLVDLGLGETQFVRQDGDMLGRDVAPAVLDQVQELDQVVAAAWPVAEELAQLVARLGPYLPPPGGDPPASPPLAGVRRRRRSLRLPADRCHCPA